MLLLLLPPKRRGRKRGRGDLLVAPPPLSSPQKHLLHPSFFSLFFSLFFHLFRFKSVLSFSLSPSSPKSSGSKPAKNFLRLFFLSASPAKATRRRRGGGGKEVSDFQNSLLRLWKLLPPKANNSSSTPSQGSELWERKFSVSVGGGFDGGGGGGSVCPASLVCCRFQRLSILKGEEEEGERKRLR